MESIKFEKSKAPPMIFFLPHGRLRKGREILMFFANFFLLIEHRKAENVVLSRMYVMRTHTRTSAHKHAELCERPLAHRVRRYYTNVCGCVEVVHIASVHWHNMDGAPMAQQHGVFSRLAIVLVFTLERERERHELDSQRTWLVDVISIAYAALFYFFSANSIAFAASARKWAKSQLTEACEGGNDVGGNVVEKYSEQSLCKC